MLRLCLVPITLFLPLSCSAAASKHGHNELHDLVRSSCAYASYSFVSLSCESKVSAYLSQVSSKVNKGKNTNKREQLALKDLSKTLNELKHLIDDTFSWQMSNAHMLVSSVLTNEDTCLDGARYNNVARVATNARCMLTRLDEGRDWPRLML
ncbi:Pectinesterase inhibitor 3 [Citrus sinensis]|uniref:Pectinesterase inhibitor 3 n=1 Tax=Citrus sinensis TaxID=2711 RepID=A0ACB8MLK6_CITSI|nr:Pectinesterase inhibitor 3 [Citrus sinensis]